MDEADSDGTSAPTEVYGHPSRLNDDRAMRRSYLPLEKNECESDQSDQSTNGKRGFVGRFSVPRRRYSRVSSGETDGSEPVIRTDNIELSSTVEPPDHNRERPSTILMVSDEVEVENTLAVTHRVPWIFSFRITRFIGTRLGISPATQPTHIPQDEPLETPSPSTIGRPIETDTNSSESTSTPSTPPPPSTRERIIQLRTSATAQLSSFFSQISSHFSDDSTPPHPDDDPTHQQLILLGGIFVGPLLFALGGFLFFLTPKEFIKTRRWGFLNLVMMVASILVIVTYSFDESSAILSERTETYGPVDHDSYLSDAAMSVSGVIKVKGNTQNDPWIKVPKLLWDFSDANSVYKWEPATPPGRRLEEKINRLPYGRVILGKDTNWDDFVNVRQFNQSSNWVLGPALGFFPVDWASVALTNSTRKSDGVVWSEPIRLMGRILIRVQFSWGGAPNASTVSSILGNSSASIPSSIRLTSINSTNSNSLIYGDDNIPLEFRGAGVRCIPRNHTLPSGRELLSSDFSHFGTSSSIWSLLWRPVAAFDQVMIRQIIALPSTETSSPVAVSDTKIPVSSLLSREDNNMPTKPPLPWICRVALIDTTTTASIPALDSRPSNNTNWISINSIFLRVLP